MGKWTQNSKKILCIVLIMCRFHSTFSQDEVSLFNSTGSSNTKVAAPESLDPTTTPIVPTEPISITRTTISSTPIPTTTTTTTPTTTTPTTTPTTTTQTTTQTTSTTTQTTTTTEPDIPVIQNSSWFDKDLEGRLHGDIDIGGLFTVHKKDDRLICGEINPLGIQALEMMLFTLDEINKDPLFLRGFKIGALIKDDCGRDTFGLEQSVVFIRDSVYSIGGAGGRKCMDEAPRHMFAGVVGPGKDATAVQVANLLTIFKIPQISYASTDPVLSDRERFPYFLRTIPSETNQAKVMVELVKKFGWKYVSIVYADTPYGLQHANTLKSRLKGNVHGIVRDVHKHGVAKGFSKTYELLNKAGICLGVQQKMIKDVNGTYDAVAKELVKSEHARGVIIYARESDAKLLMKSMLSYNKTNHFVWIGSDKWAEGTMETEELQGEIEGAITVQPKSKSSISFDKYFLGLDPNNPKQHIRNPWFKSYWEQQFRCKFPNTTWTIFNKPYRHTPCTGYERLETVYKSEPQLQFVSDAVLAFANSLRDLRKNLCKKGTGICEEMKQAASGNSLGQKIIKQLYQVEFVTLNGQYTNDDDKLHFNNKTGEFRARYRLLNYQQKHPGVFTWEDVGTFDSETGLKINKERLKFKYNKTKPPESVCSRPCNRGERISYYQNQRCCWSCHNCTEYQYLLNPETCADCPNGTVPNRFLNSCTTIPPEYLGYSSGVAIVALVYSFLGIVFTGFVIVIFILYRDTPVVKASGRELSFVLLGGIVYCYLMTFVLVAKPSDFICGMQKFNIGICFTICYSALLIKTNRINRIFSAGKKTVKRPKFISPKSQLIICALSVGIQVVIVILWLLISPPKEEYIYPMRDKNLLVCRTAVGEEYIIGLAYPVVLLIVCCVYAILTRKIPEAFNESRYIGLTVYTTCIIWLAFVPIFFSTASNIPVRIASLCFCISLSATVSLACLFAPKLYIILLRPSRNVRKSMKKGCETSLKENEKYANNFKTHDSWSRDSGMPHSDEVELAKHRWRPRHDSLTSETSQTAMHPALTTYGTAMDPSVHTPRPILQESMQIPSQIKDGTEVQSPLIDSPGSDFEVEEDEETCSIIKRDKNDRSSDSEIISENKAGSKSGSKSSINKLERKDTKSESESSSQQKNLSDAMPAMLDLDEQLNTPDEMKSSLLDSPSSDFNVESDEETCSIINRDKNDRGSNKDLLADGNKSEGKKTPDSEEGKRTRPNSANFE